MEDIIKHGDDRPPASGRRRWLIAAALAVVVALVVVEHLPGRHGGSSAAGHGHITGPSPGRPVAGGPVTLPPSGIVGRTAGWAADARVPRSGAQPAWFWPALGRVAPILGLPPDRFGYVFTRVDGGWAIQPDPPGPAGCSNCTPPDPSPGPASCGDCTGPPIPVFYLADRARRAVRVGSASLVAPAAGKGRMWLTTFPSETNLAKTPGVARLIDSAGAEVGAPVTLPAGYGIIQGTGHDLLIESLSEGALINNDRLWNPATGKVRRTFDAVVAVSAAAIAYAPPCVLTCPVQVYNVASGREVTIKMRPTDTAASGVFSPDGRFLALQISRGNGQVSDGGASAIQLEVASAATGRAEVVPRIFVSGDAFAAFGWPGSRDVLVAEFSLNGAVQMASWNPVVGGDVAVADIKPADDPAALIVG